jgi:RHS repeat-associated protein
LSAGVDPATNRLTAESYDANGNQLTSAGGASLAYDLANRLASWNSVETYGYNPGNKRVLKTDTSAHVDTLYFYGLDGRRMGTYRLNNCPSGCYLSTVSTDVYFKGRLVKSGNEAVVTDRLGSVKRRKDLSTSVTTSFDFWPYGEEKASATTNNRDKFGTYYRDSSSGLDYADQRYYRNEGGRFMTVDPAASGLNHYSYTSGDPVNKGDPRGLDPVPVPGTSITVTAQAPRANVTMFCPSTGFEIVEWFECPGYEWMSNNYVSIQYIQQVDDYGYNNGVEEWVPPLTTELNESVERVINNMTEKCAQGIGAPTLEAASQKLWYAAISAAHLGVPEFTGGVSTGGNMAISIKDFNKIQFNLDINWSNPTSQTVIVDGLTTTMDLSAAMINAANQELAASGSSAQVGAVSPEQFFDWIMIHELAHLFGPSFDGRNGALWELCF